MVFPQGIGALAAQSELPPNGLVGLIDVGYRTVDYLMAQTNSEGIPQPLLDRSGTYTGGMHQAYLALAQMVESETGVHFEPHELAEKDVVTADVVTARGQRISLAALAADLQHHLETRWEGLLDRLDAVYLAGGGALALSPHLHWPGAVVVPEAQWANAAGFLLLAG
jgi:plasmid segregation protein ParM